MAMIMTIKIIRITLTVNKNDSNGNTNNEDNNETISMIMAVIRNPPIKKREATSFSVYNY